MEKPLSKKQLSFLTRYFKGEKFLMGELDSIPSNLFKKGIRVYGLCEKAIKEKIFEDSILKGE